MTINSNDALLALFEQGNFSGGEDLTRQILEAGLQALIDAQTTAHLKAQRYERTGERVSQRNGSRDKLLTTKAGDVTLSLPKLRQGTFFPSVLEPRRRVDHALQAVVMEAYVNGVSTRKVDALVQALGSDVGISKSEVSRICQSLDEQVNEFKTRSLKERAYPFVYVDATYLKERKDHRIVSTALLVAVGVRDDGVLENLGFMVGDSENETTWSEFFTTLKERGLTGVQLVISDAHTGLKKAIQAQFQGCSWQRCSVHFMRNVLAKIPKKKQDAASAWLKTIFNQATTAKTRQAYDEAAQQLRLLSHNAGELLDEAREDVLAFLGFNRHHWRKIKSTNVLERLNREIKRRTRVVSIFPNESAIERLVGTILMEQHDEWSLRHYISTEKISHLEPEEVN